MRRKGARSAVRDYPMEGEGHEQKIDQSAPDAKRRHHFRGVTKKVDFNAPPHIPCVKMKTKIKTKIKVKWNEMELNEMEWN